VGVLAGSGTGRQADEDSGDAGGWGFASSTDPETWASFETALEYTETKHADGVGFVFTDDDPIVGVDIDDCRDPETGDVDDAALDIIGRLDSYTEVSPSGTGYHVLLTGELPDGRNRRGASSCTTRHAFSPSLASTSSGHPRALHVDRTRLQQFTASTSRTPSVTPHPSPGSVMTLTTSQHLAVASTLTSTSKTRTSSRKAKRIERREVRAALEREYGRLRQSVRGRYGAVLFAGVLDRRRPDADGAAVSPVRIASGEVGRGPLR